MHLFVVIQGIWWGLIIGVAVQTVALIVITARTNWDSEVSSPFSHSRMISAESSAQFLFVAVLMVTRLCHVCVQVEKAIQRLRHTAADEGGMVVGDDV